MRWQRGPTTWTAENHEQMSSMVTPLAIPSSAVGGVKAGLLQCFFCGRFGHSYNERGCDNYNGNADRAGAHFKDWRRVTNNKIYSLNALFPQQYSLPINQSARPFKPKANALEVSETPETRTVEVSALDWSSDGFGLAGSDGDIPTEYLFDGGATDAVSNDRSLILNYQPFPSPIPIKTAANDSNAVIVGKGQMVIDVDDGEVALIDDVYYCPKATTTIILPGALLARGARISMTDDNDYVIRLKCGKTIHAVHQNRRWFIQSKKRLHQRSTSCARAACKSSIYSHSVCAMKSLYSLSKLWHARLGHMSMRRIKKLFKQHDAYGLPEVKPCDVQFEDCPTCKSTRTRVLGSTGRDPGVLEMVVTDVAGPFTPCLSGEQLMVTFREVRSTYSDICIIKHKSEVHQRLINVIAKWERATGLRVKAIQSDRGGEYISGALDKWLKASGIAHEFSNPHEPE